MFIDKVKLNLKAGNGGNGMIAFRREKGIDKGGPSGGNGGRGGSIYFKATNSINTLIEYRFMHKVAGVDGEKGLVKQMYGKDAPDIFLEVPVGSVIIDERNGNVLKDLSKDGETYLICKGGRGGRGNTCFKSSTNRTPNIAENGLPGEEKNVIVELKLLADVGLVGLPSVGKSTFLSIVSAAKPEIAPYPFTTLVPNLGVTYLKDNSSFVIADLPGLIEGAHLGKGLGLAFLRHIERCRVLLHILDMEKENPLEDFKLINSELEHYNMKLLDRRMIVVCNKIDVEGGYNRYLEVKKALEGKYDVFGISCITKIGVDEVLYKTKDALVDAPFIPIFDEEEKEVVVDAFKNAGPIFEITKSDGVFEITGARVLRTYNLINNKTDEGIMRLTSYLRKIGVEDRLRELGIKDGDTVKIADFEFEYYE